MDESSRRNEKLQNVWFFEYPFVHEGMTVGEFEDELYYLGTHQKEYREGTYIPLWKQRLEK